MQKGPSVGVVIFGLAVVATAGYFFSRAPRTAQSAGPALKQPKRHAAAWDAYAGSRLAFEKPRTWTIRTKEIEVQHRLAWIAEAPPQNEFLPGMSIVLSEYTDGKEKRPLEEIYKNTTWQAERIHSAQNILVNGGKCLDYRIDYVEHDLEFDQNGGSRAVQICTRRNAHAHCYSDDGRYFETKSLLGQFCDRSQPDSATVQREKIYTRLLRSLQFKPVS